jgi:ATP-binding cassette subfamily C (CFTR/MRP) protein 1
MIQILEANYALQLNRAMTRFRSASTMLIYNKALTTKAGYDDLKALTLMSTDLDAIESLVGTILDLWASVLKLFIGICLLWRQLGVISIAPFITIVLCSIAQGKGSKAAPPKQKLWREAVQRRVGLTTIVLQQIKSIKLGGLVGSMIHLLKSERIRELDLAKQYRSAIVALNIICKIFRMLLSKR